MENMMICQDCGSVKPLDEIRTETSYLCSFDAAPYYEEVLSQCMCGGDYVPAIKCEKCNKYFSKDDMYGELCKFCDEKQQIEEEKELSPKCK